MGRLKKLMILAPMFVMMLTMTACGSRYHNPLDILLSPLMLMFGWPLIFIIGIVVLVNVIKAASKTKSVNDYYRRQAEIKKCREKYYEELREDARLERFAEEVGKAEVGEEGVSLLDANVLKTDSKAERKIVKLIESLGYVANTQVTDEELVDKAPLRFDVVTQINDDILVFEYDGPHHTQADMHKNRESYDTQRRHDKMKNEFCLRKGYHLYRIPYTDTEYLKDVEKIIKNAKKGKFDHKLKVKV